jgi:hypothetical protein
MRGLLKTALFVLPFALVFVGLRWLRGDEAERWRDRVLPHCPGAVVGVDEEGLIVVGPDREQAVAAAAEVRDFRRELTRRYADLLGKPRFARMVIVVFPDARSVQAYAGEAARLDRGAAGKIHGYTDPLHGAVFVPANALETLRHETVHWVMETARSPADPPYSPWLSEGLAQLFETFDPADPRPPKPPRLAVRDVDVDRLIRIQDYGEFLGRDVHRNYEEALVLSSFLHETRGKELREYVEAERRSADGRPFVFRKIFRNDEEPFRRDLAAFIAGRR